MRTRIPGLLVYLSILSACLPIVANGANSKTLSCSPKTLYLGDTLTLTMGVPHGGYLGVVDPGGTWYFVVFPGPPDGEKTSIMSSDEFKELGRFKFMTDATKAAPWVANRKTNSLIFTTPGRYKILVSDNLEGESSADHRECYVNYRIKKRKGN